MIGMILFLVVIGVAIELLKTQVPMDSNIRILINVLIVVFVVYMLLSMFGIVDVPMPKLRG